MLWLLGGVALLTVGLAVFSRSPEIPGERRASEPAPGSASNESPSPALATVAVRLQYDLEAVAAGAPVPRVFAETLPENAKQTGMFRDDMVRAALPLVLLANEEVLIERGQLWDLRFNLKRGFRLPPERRLWIEVLAERYGASSDDLDELTRRVDVVPPSVVLALVGEALEQERREALERERKAAARGAKAGPVAESAEGLPWSKRVSREKIPDLNRAPLEYVRAVIRALNTDAAYESFRAERSRLRQAGEPLDGLRLAAALPELRRGAIRTADLGASINTHRLTRFDQARLQPTGSSG